MAKLPVLPPLADIQFRKSEDEQLRRLVQDIKSMHATLGTLMKVVQALQESVNSLTPDT